MGADSERLAARNEAMRLLAQEIAVEVLIERLRAAVTERDMLLALIDDACASDDLTVLRDWQTGRLLKEAGG